MSEPEWQEEDETRILAEAQRGDVEAFGKLYEHYAGRVLRFLYAHMTDRQDAEDLTMEVFIKVWRSLPNYRQRGTPFAGYLFRAARNALTDHYRRQGRASQAAQLGENKVWDESGNPARRLTADQERAELRAALAELRVDYRSVLSLRFFGGLNTEEIAAAMRRSPGAVRVLQHRALAALRILLEE